jgi:glycosyltransferase involved in cell wall biosynthesis
LSLPTVSVIIPTYKREQVLVETLNLLAPLLQVGDEILVIDQSPRHEPATEEGLRALASAGTIRWYRRARPSQNEAMNAAACLARGDVLLFLDDDVVPFAELIEAHRTALNADPTLSATCGQVLQPWDKGPVDEVVDFALGFNAAYSKPCDILSLMAGNFAMRRETYFEVGGMDENYCGSNYRNDAEMSYRIFRRTGVKVRFVPEAGMRHLYAGGGNRAFGAKDTWGHIGGSIGDYYFALRCLPFLSCLQHTVTRFVRAPLNRNTVRHPWLIASLFVREAVAWFRAFGRVWTKPNNYIKDAAYYGVTAVLDAVAV